MKYVLYDTASGGVLQTGSGPDNATPPQVDGARVLLVESLPGSIEGWRVIDGALQYTGRPGPLHIWRHDAATWEVSIPLIVAQRNALLVASDWTQLPDAPSAGKAAWASYRQALRDLTDQAGYPNEIVWPIAP